MIQHAASVHASKTRLEACGGPHRRRHRDTEAEHPFVRSRNRETENIASLTPTIPPSLKRLAEMVQRKQIFSWILSADCTCGAETNNAEIGLLYASVHRGLDPNALWRNSSWPVVACRVSRENHRVYRSLFGTLQSELAAPKLTEDQLGSRPFGPDGWMLLDAVHTHHLPGIGTVSLPTIDQIHNDHFCECHARMTSCYFLVVRTPGPLDQEMVQRMLGTLFATEDKVTGCRQALGVMAAMQIGTAPWKVAGKGIRAMLAIAVMIRMENGAACICVGVCRRDLCAAGAHEVEVQDPSLSKKKDADVSSAGKAQEE